MTILALRALTFRRIGAADVSRGIDRLVTSPVFRRKEIFVALAIILSVWFGLQTGSFPIEWDTDSPSYYAAAHAISRGVNAYDDPAFQNLGNELFGKANLVYPYIYPPLLAQMILPLARLPYNAYFTVLYVANMALAFLALYLLAVLLELRDPRTFLPLLFPFALFISNEPVLTTIHHGQVNFLVFDAILGFLIFQKKGRPWPAGAFLALAVFIKLYPVLFVLPFLLHKKWRALAAFAASSAGLLGGSILVSGISPWLDFGRSTLTLFWMRPDSPFTRGFQDSMGNYSLKSFLASLFPRLGLPPGLVAPAFLLLALGLFAAVFASRRRALIAAEPVLLGSFLLLLTNILAPITWSHHFVLVLLPAVYLFRRIIRERRYAAIPVLALCLFEVFHAVPWGAFPFNQVRLAAALGLYAMLFVFAGRPAAEIVPDVA
jgi:alpha-1,2-mannosyltransferase